MGETNYKAYYIKKTFTYKEGTIKESFTAWWIDQGTGIIFRMKIGNAQVVELYSTTADLTEAGILTGYCLGTMHIALISVVTLVSYSIVSYRQQKKKKKSN
jgi:hypothetical protein